MNLYQAIALATSEEAKGAGVLALFSDTIYSGRDIQKINSYKTDAFEIGDFGCLGYMRDDHVYFLSKTDKPHTAHSIFLNTRYIPSPRLRLLIITAEQTVICFLPCLTIVKVWSLPAAEAAITAVHGKSRYTFSQNQR